MIVALGTHTNMVDFLEKGRKGMASTLLVRMKIGTKLVDAGVNQLYRSRMRWRELSLLGVASAFPVMALAAINPRSAPPVSNAVAASENACHLGDSMLTTRYHLSTIVAIFFALGIGILLGGSLGQQWLSERQQALVDRLEKRYEEVQDRSHQLEKRIGVLQSELMAGRRQNRELLKTAVKDQLEGRRILLIGGERQVADSLSEVIRWAGGSVSQASGWADVPGEADAILLLERFPDEWKSGVMKRLKEGLSMPVIVQVVNQKNRETSPWGVSPFTSMPGRSMIIP